MTDRAQARTPEAATERIDDSTIALTFAVPGGANVPPILSTTTYTWDEATSAVVAEDLQPAAEPRADSTVDGRWCPTAESNDRYGCVTVTLPTATYDNGNIVDLTGGGDQNADGGTQFSVPGAPFGTFYPAGTTIDLPDYYTGADLPDQDRIWNGQTAVMLVRD